MLYCTYVACTYVCMYMHWVQAGSQLVTSKKGDIAKSRNVLKEKCIYYTWRLVQGVGESPQNFGR